MTNETLTEERVDAISEIIYDPSGTQSGEYYPANSTHFFGKPIKSAVRVQSRKSDVRDVRLCAAGNLCLRYEHRKAAPAKGRGQYCSRNCSESFKVRSRASLTQPTADHSEMAI